MAGCRECGSRWAGATRISTGTAWEPTVAADPHGPAIYALWLQFPGSSGVLRVSRDRGETWNVSSPVLRSDNPQYNPVIKALAEGTVYSTLIDRDSVMFGKSVDHGTTWHFEQIGATSDGVDKPWIGADISGANVYLAYEDYRGLLIAASHDSGASFSLPVLAESEAMYSHFPCGLTVLPNGTAIVSTTAYSDDHALPIEAFSTTDGGRSWSRSILDTVHIGTHWYLSSATTVTSDVTGSNVVAVYSGARTDRGNGHIYTKRSVDAGATWDSRQELTSGTGNASFPAAVGGPTGSIRVAWQEVRRGAWNTYYRESSNGGITWTRERRISDGPLGASYRSANGYGGPFGDNFSIDVDSTGRTIAVWGEGVSFTSNLGAVHFNRQT